MFGHKIQFFSVALVVLWSAVGVYCSYDPYCCTKPAVRKEWRAFSIKEKAEWIRAVNVRMHSTLAWAILLRIYVPIQCLSKLPHDSALTPSVDPSVSVIPPVNASSSYYDGMVQSIGFAFLIGGSNCIFHRLGLRPHGFEYSCGFKGTPWIRSDLNVLVFQIHWTGQFLPWHRWYLHVIEESLKNKCNYTGVSPYWNWTIGHPSFVSIAL